MRRKVALTAAAVAMVGTLAVGGTLAWFTDTETATNVITTGNVDIAIHERKDSTEWGKETLVTEPDSFLTYGDDTPVVPGEELVKEVNIQNTGANDALVKVEIDLPDGVTPVYDTENWYFNEGEDTFYYKNVLKANDAYTGVLLKGLKIDEAGNEFTNKDDLVVTIMAYAIQADHLTVDDQTVNTDNLSLEILEKAFGENITDYDKIVNDTDEEVGNDGVVEAEEEENGDDTI